MNKNSFLTGRLGFVVCAALLGALAGCVGHVDQSGSRGAYYVQPPSEQVQASVGVSIRTEEDFYDPLSPYGRWEVVGPHGRCWIPGRVDADWRPYCEGYWQRTDAGWYWASDEPWSWATYHYGRWDFTDQYGWYWVPQTQWAPAWVSWHRGGGYIGWEPLYTSDVRVSSPRAYVVVEERRFLDPVRPSTVVVNNTTIINQTVINEAPATAVIEKASGRKVQALPVQEVRYKAEAAVVAKQKTPATIPQQMAGTPVRNEVQPSNKTTVVAHAPPQVGKPPAATLPAVAPAPKNHEAQSQKPKPVLATSQPKPVVKSAAKPEARPESNHPAAIMESTQSKANQHAETEAKPVKPSDKQMQQPAKEKPVASEKTDPNTAEKDHENKGKE